MKRIRLYVVCILSAVLIFSLGSLAFAGKTEWDCQYKSKLTVKGQFTDRMTTYGEIIINESKKTWKAITPCLSCVIHES